MNISRANMGTHANLSVILHEQGGSDFHHLHVLLPCHFFFFIVETNHHGGNRRLQLRTARPGDFDLAQWITNFISVTETHWSRRWQLQGHPSSGTPGRRAIEDDGRSARVAVYFQIDNLNRTSASMTPGQHDNEILVYRVESNPDLRLTPSEYVGDPLPVLGPSGELVSQLPPGRRARSMFLHTSDVSSRTSHFSEGRDIDQIVAVHEVGHALGLDHPNLSDPHCTRGNQPICYGPAHSEMELGVMGRGMEFYISHYTPFIRIMQTLMPDMNWSVIPASTQTSRSARRPQRAGQLVP